MVKERRQRDFGCQALNDLRCIHGQGLSYYGTAFLVDPRQIHLSTECLSTYIPYTPLLVGELQPTLVPTGYVTNPILYG